MIAKIALFSPLRKLFDYKIPQSIAAKPLIGTRVIVPFGKKTVIGFIADTSNYSDIPEDKLKTIIEVLDQEPIFSNQLYQTLLWAANYYQSSIGAILDAALPKYIKENKVPKNYSLGINHSLSVNIKNINTQNISLNAAQQDAINNIINNCDKFNINLLEGVTGSGKTEVYLQLTKAMLGKDKQILILVPEIGLTPQTYQHFTERFTNIPIAILHSNLTAKQRYLNWLNAKNGTAKIILGTRSAAFVPLLNPGLFIIDEEHDLSFKQQESINYMARDFLIMRAKHSNCPIILGSATPSLETIYNTQSNKYQLYKLPNRINSQLPEIEIIDTRHKKLSNGLSNAVIHEIELQLSQKNQVLLFINRRGFAPLLKCFSCNFIKKCSNCDANMILHIYTNKLHCHHCSKIDNIPINCPTCQANKLTPIGQGTERIEELLQKLFPNVNIQRIDQDSTTKKQEFNKILADILELKVDLLIGTQMIAKGHHFPKLSLVVIVDSDQALFSNDFRATERLGQLILQVAGRAGREKSGKVLLQTNHPNHKLIQAIVTHDYQQFANLLLEERKLIGLPPFSHQILWRTNSKSINIGTNFLNKVKQLALDFNDKCEIFGPVPAIMEKRKKKFHARLLFQHSRRDVLQEICSHILKALDSQKIPSSLTWSVDVDPKETF